MDAYDRQRTPEASFITASVVLAPSEPDDLVAFATLLSVPDMSTPNVVVLAKVKIRGKNWVGCKRGREVLGSSADGTAAAECSVYKWEIALMIDETRLPRNSDRVAIWLNENERETRKPRPRRVRANMHRLYHDDFVEESLE